MEWVLRVFQSRKRSLMLTLLKSHVISPTRVLLPALEYMESKRHICIQAIEAIRRTFTHKITEVQHLNYWERLYELKLYLFRDAINVI